MTDTQVDLTNCDREPIHIPGAVQPHCVLVAGIAGELTISHASANVAALLGRSADSLLGAEFADVFSHQAMHEIGNAELASPEPGQPGLLFGLRIPGAEGTFDVAVHQYEERRILELQASDAKNSALDDASPMSLVNAFAARLRESRSLDALCDTAATSVRRLLGYHRVMVYRFHEDGSGQVLAESKRWDLESFLGLRYPATDIPKQARELYKRNLTRLIADVNAEPAPILARQDVADRPLDLTYSCGRAVSPIHIEYLQNMGVGASMSISVIVGGRLWGLIACHHYSAKAVSLRVRSAAQLFAQFFSVHLEAAERAENFEALHAARDRIDTLVRSLAPEGSVFESLANQTEKLKSVIDADGFALVVAGEIAASGDTPDESEISDLVQLLVDESRGRVLATHELAQVVPSAERYRETASGLLAIPFAKETGDFLLYFRRELPQKVVWAGEPTKTVAEDDKVRLSPRKSFAAWQEERRGVSTPWSPSDRLLAETLRVSLLEVTLGAREAAVAERNESRERQRVLISELNHRVKNILALMSALVARGRESADSIEEYVQALEGRIRALAFAHDHITRSSISSFRALLESETAPYQLAKRAIELDGPPVTLDSRAFPIVALVIHELTTNAAKYGALATETGRLGVSWRRLDGGDLEIVWVERGGPEVKEPSRSGFGSVLIERNIPFELGGKAKVEYAPEGLRAAFVIPASHVVEVEEREIRKTTRPAPLAGLDGYHVLVVEDQMMIALNTQRMLDELGADKVETAATTADALRLLEQFERPVAVLDVNLGKETSIELASELRRRGIPFVFATGYSDSIMIPPDFHDVPVVRKPYSRKDLYEALMQVIEGAHAS
ncbi:MAG: GAF domain-containing protein [Bryobacterales bacterium]